MWNWSHLSESADCVIFYAIGAIKSTITDAKLNFLIVILPTQDDGTLLQQLR